MIELFFVSAPALTKHAFLTPIRKAKSSAPAWTFPNRGAKHLKHPSIFPAGSRAAPMVGAVWYLVFWCK